MKKVLLTALLMTVSAFGLIGCFPNYSYTPQPVTYKNSYVPPHYHIDTSKAVYKDKHLHVELIPVKDNDNGLYKSFEIKIVNKRDKDLKLIWDESYFIENGQTNGGFMFDGVRYVDRNASKQPLLILGKSTVTVQVYPSNKVEYLSMLHYWLHHKNEGECGVYLTISGKNYNKNIKLYVSILEQ